MYSNTNPPGFGNACRFKGDSCHISKDLTGELMRQYLYAYRFQVTSESRKVYLNLYENGQNVAAKRIPHRRLYRVENENTSFIAGLGHYTCKEIIERHRGSIGVESDPPKGSTFWFEQPVNN